MDLLRKCPKHENDGMELSNVFLLRVSINLPENILCSKGLQSKKKGNPWRIHTLINQHFIPNDAEIWEFDKRTQTANRIK